jgi:hypothetical protein
MWDKAIRTNLYGAFLLLPALHPGAQGIGAARATTPSCSTSRWSIPSSERPSQPRSPGWCSWRRATTTT